MYVKYLASYLKPSWHSSINVVILSPEITCLNTGKTKVTRKTVMDFKKSRLTKRSSETLPYQQLQE